MTGKEVLNKAYGNIPKEVGLNLNLFSWDPVFRGFKYYWYKFLRSFTR